MKKPDVRAIKPELTFTDAEVKVMDRFTELIAEHFITRPGLTITQIMEFSKALHQMAAVRNKINDHVMEFIKNPAE